MSEEPRERSHSIATRGGDGGETALLYGKRVPKSHPQIECCGAIDELSAALGVARAAGGPPGLSSAIEGIQRSLIAIMGEVACDPEQLTRYRESSFSQIAPSDLEGLDQEIDRIEKLLPPFVDWVLPGSTPVTAALDAARATARRAERRLVELGESAGFPVRSLILQYFNRLSDFLWLRAREIEAIERKASQQEDA